MSFKDKLRAYLFAGYPCVVVRTAEEERAMADIRHVVASTEWTLWQWTAVRGLVQLAPVIKQVAGTEGRAGLFKQRVQNAIIVLTDCHTWQLEETTINRGLREFIQDHVSPQLDSRVIIVAPSFEPPSTVAHACAVLDYELPTKEDLGKLAQAVTERWAADVQKEPPAVPPAVASNLAGLTFDEATRAIGLALQTKGELDLDLLMHEKMAAVRRGGILKVLPPSPIEDVGGLDALKKWIKKRANSFGDEAKSYGLPVARGVLIIGPPGTGKSLVAKAISAVLKRPLILLDIGALFNSLVGASEERTRQVLKQAEAIAPAVLFLDEIDKGFAGTSGGGNGDSGVSRRVFGTVLTWLQEKTAPVYVVASANSVEHLPPEMLRKGRFDEIWFVDLPTTSERMAIFAIHLKKVGRDPDKFNLPALANVAGEFSGAEIEAAIADALYDCFDAGHDLTTEAIVAACSRTTPLARVASETIEATRAWASTRARAASEPEASPAGLPRFRSNSN